MSDIAEIIEDFLRVEFPVKKMKVPNGTPQNTPSHKGNFKRVILINKNAIYRMSDKSERYNAMYALSKIICRVFAISQAESISLIKKHLHLS